MLPERLGRGVQVYADSDDGGACRPPPSLGHSRRSRPAARWRGRRVLLYQPLKSSRNSDLGSVLVTSRRSRALVQAT